MTSELLKKYDLKKIPNRINWEITEACNFNCAYCINHVNEKSHQAKVYTPHQISSFFNATQRQWLVLITGGEPFIYPNFVDVCKGLTAQHHLQITSNLSAPEVYAFADTVPPEKVFLLSASYHFTHRKELNLIDDFINKCLYLKEKGFAVLVNYIALPETLNRMEEDLLMFEKLGIEVFALMLRGKYKGKIYPEAYTQEALDLIYRFVLDKETESCAAFGELNFYGHYCEAGQNYFFMNQYGDVSRCTTLHKKMGNLFENNFVPYPKPRVCTATHCNDVYCGLAAVTPKRASTFSVWLEKNKYNKL